MTTKTIRYKRRIKWVRPDIQLDMLLTFVIVTAVALVVNVELSLLGVWNMLEGASQEQALVLHEVSGLTLKLFFVSIIIGMALSIFVGVYHTFKFCGPIYRMNLHLKGLVTGRWDETCRLRQKDGLKDVNDNLNAGIGAVVDHVRQLHEALSEARDALQAAGVEAPAALAEKWSHLDAEFQRRLGDPEEAQEIEPVGEPVVESVDETAHA